MSEAPPREPGIDILTDGEGNYYRYRDGRVLCNHGTCPEFFCLHGKGKDDYFWACPAHGVPLPPTICPECDGERMWDFPRNKGMIPTCRACTAAAAFKDDPTPVAAPPLTRDDAEIADEIQEARSNLMALCDRMIDRQLMDEVAPVVETLRALEARLRDSRGAR